MRAKPPSIGLLFAIAPLRYSFCSADSPHRDFCCAGRQIGTHWSGTMRVGLQVPNLTWPNRPGELGETFTLIAERAERAGFYSFRMMDHFFQIRGIGPAEHEMLEGWSALAFAAGH